MSVTYTAVLPVREQTVTFLTGLLMAERVRRGTGAGTRAQPARDQAILVLRWSLDGTRIRQLARDNQVRMSTGYGYLHEGIDVLAARSPGAATSTDPTRSDARRRPSHRPRRAVQVRHLPA
jgi:hypothetical protein